MKGTYILFSFLLLSFAVLAQKADSTLLKIDSIHHQVDSLVSKVAVDTVRKETKQERKARERAEKERAKYYYKDILKDSARLEIEHVSRVAWKRSLILPGWGQYTNGGLWWIKVPVLYGGFTALYMSFDYWNWYYRKFADEAAFRTDNNGAWSDPDLQNISQLSTLVTYKDRYRQYRDWMVILTIGTWGLNVIEAYTDSMLRNRYNVTDDLTLKITPTLLSTGNGLAYQPSFRSQFVPGVKLTMSLR